VAKEKDLAREEGGRFSTFTGDQGGGFPKEAGDEEVDAGLSPRSSSRMDRTEGKRNLACRKPNPSKEKQAGNAWKITLSRNG